MKTVANVLWLVLGALWLALGWLFWALILAIAVVGIPFGVQAIKMAGLAVQPFGKKIVRTKDMTTFYAGVAATS